MKYVWIVGRQHPGCFSKPDFVISSDGCEDSQSLMSKMLRKNSDNCPISLSLGITPTAPY